jgi:cyclopropane fatty-acyl-phospholipid synthase-like methyltransferase
LGEDAERTRDFVMSMHHWVTAVGRLAVPHIRLNGRRHLLDVGGGPGTYSVLIARENPAIQCTILDLPPVTRIADEIIAQSCGSARVKTLAGNYHKTPFPQGIDAINLFGVLHQEPPDSIRSLLQKAFDALPSGGVVHVMDMMTDSSRSSPRYSALFALNVALNSACGWVFSVSDLDRWLRQVGFTGLEVIPLPAPMPHSLVTAHKP